MNKLSEFCKEVYHPGVHLYFALNWYLGLHFALSFNHQKGVSFSYDGVIAIVTLFLVLFYLRVIDEIKDYDYDKVFNTDRPLVRGMVSHKNLFHYCLVSGSAGLLLNLPFFSLPLFIIAIDLFYSTLLILIEKKFPVIKDNILLNLIFTYPVNILLSFYILYLDLFFWKEQVLIRDYLFITAFAAAFLYYEFARKISWPHQETEGQRTYSSFFGTALSIVIAMAFALIGMSLLVYLYDSLIPLLLLFPLFLGLLHFKRSRGKEKGFAMKLSGSAFIGLFYGTVICLAVIKAGLLS